MTGEVKDGKTIPMGVKIAIWVTCAALYVTQVSAQSPEYQKYVTTVPILLPFVPLYNVEKHKWLVA